MRSSYVTSALFLIFAFSSCRKESVSITPVTPQQPSEPEQPVANDSISLLTNKWTLIKEIVTAENGYHFNEGGRELIPISGEYLNQGYDYWEFRKDGSLSVNEMGLTQTTYTLCSNNRLIIQALMVFDTAYVVKLSKTELNVEWKATSSNGGTYYRQAFLKR